MIAIGNIVAPNYLAIRYGFNFYYRVLAVLDTHGYRGVETTLDKWNGRIPPLISFVQSAERSFANNAH